jgi:hypothetical protein
MAIHVKQEETNQSGILVQMEGGQAGILRGDDTCMLSQSLNLSLSMPAQAYLLRTPIYNI